MTTYADRLRPPRRRSTRLRIVAALPPDPHPGAGAYDVRLELSRPLTAHERRALAELSRDAHAEEGLLTLPDTTLERVAEDAGRLAWLVHRLEQEGRRLQDGPEQATFTDRADDERRRLSELASSIRFPDVGAGPVAHVEPPREGPETVSRRASTPQGRDVVHRVRAQAVVEELERRIVRLDGAAAAGAQVPGEDVVALVPGSGEPPD
jgi:hypothetical protein